MITAGLGYLRTVTNKYGYIPLKERREKRLEAPPAQDLIRILS